MRYSALVAAICAGSLGAAAHAGTVTFKFDWEAVSASSTSDETVTASGLIALDGVSAGDRFGAGNLHSLSLFVRGDSIADLTLTEDDPDIFLDGTIAADGITAALTDFFVGALNVYGFGCALAGCVQTAGGSNIVAGEEPPNPLATATYRSPVSALESMFLERVEAPAEMSVVPLPASAPLLLAALAALAVWRRRSAV
ncbi:MAG: VPLPA-CTERM sorting domain-containing protein [Paracoccaceae bacterium]|nr:VPLPA-CTERM sorting domain-containing protein [Paracoccaceae bacterium]